MEIHVTAILLQMLNFGVVVGALTYFLLKPIRNILDERARKVAEGQAAAQAALAEKANIDKMKADVSKEAKQEAKAIIAAAREEAQAKRDEIVAAAKEEAQAERAALLKSAEKEKATLVKQWQTEFEAAVLMVAKNVVGESLDANKHAKLIEQGLKEIAASK